MNNNFYKKYQDVIEKAIDEGYYLFVPDYPAIANSTILDFSKEHAQIVEAERSDSHPELGSADYPDAATIDHPLWKAYLDGFTHPQDRQVATCNECKRQLVETGSLLVADGEGTFKPLFWGEYDFAENAIERSIMESVFEQLTSDLELYGVRPYTIGNGVGKWKIDGKHSHFNVCPDKLKHASGQNELIDVFINSRGIIYDKDLDEYRELVEKLSYCLPTEHSAFKNARRYLDLRVRARDNDEDLSYKESVYVQLTTFGQIGMALKAHTNPILSLIANYRKNGEDMTLEDLVRVLEKTLAGDAYMRSTTTGVSQGQVDGFIKLVNEMGLGGTFERRSLKVSELPKITEYVGAEKLWLAPATTEEKVEKTTSRFDEMVGKLKKGEGDASETLQIGTIDLLPKLKELGDDVESVKISFGHCALSVGGVDITSDLNGPTIHRNGLRGEIWLNTEIKRTFDLFYPETRATLLGIVGRGETTGMVFSASDMRDEIRQTYLTSLPLFPHSLISSLHPYRKTIERLVVREGYELKDDDVFVIENFGHTYQTKPTVYIKTKRNVILIAKLDRIS